MTLNSFSLMQISKKVLALGIQAIRFFSLCCPSVVPCFYFDIYEVVNSF